jgi:hypothetical protein
VSEIDRAPAIDFPAGDSTGGMTKRFLFLTAVAAVAACGHNNPSIDPSTQWELDLHVTGEGGAAGKVQVDADSAQGDPQDCTGDCVYGFDDNLDLSVIALEPLTDTGDPTVAAWTGDCADQLVDGNPALTAGAGDVLDCTATFEPEGAETCDNQIDDDADGDIDCSDTSCASFTGCDVISFGDFGDDYGLTYNQVGTSTCGLPDPMPDFDFTPGGLVFADFGDDTNVFFAIDAGTTNQSTATDVTILGVDGHTCTLFESEFGTAPIHVVFSFNCTNPGGGSCSQGFSADRP